MTGRIGPAMMRQVFVNLAAVTTAACTTVPVGPPAQRGCPIAGSSDWAAWVDAMPGPGSRPRLIVAGKVDAPTGGYRFEWTDFRVAESFPVQVFAELRPIPPIGGAIQVVVAHEVRGEWPVEPQVGSVTITCGGITLARISPVETAH